MPYRLAIDPAAEEEWARLDSSVKTRFKTKLAERLENPRVPAVALSGSPDIYKIKITTPQIRLAYHVDVTAKRVTILAVTSRDDRCQEEKSCLQCRRTRKEVERDTSASPGPAGPAVVALAGMNANEQVAPDILFVSRDD